MPIDLSRRILMAGPRMAECHRIQGAVSLVCLGNFTDESELAFAPWLHPEGDRVLAERELQQRGWPVELESSRREGASVIVVAELAELALDAAQNDAKALVVVATAEHVVRPAWRSRAPHLKGVAQLGDCAARPMIAVDAETLQMLSHDLLPR